MAPIRKIVLIMTDTQRADMLGCYGNPAMQTPALDRLASQGIRFDRAYTCQPVCGPARSALFTGTFPHTNGSWGNSMPLGDNVKTLGQRLRDKGVHTAYVGKWHLDGGDYFGLGQCPDGWDADYWYDMRNYLEELTPEQRQWSRRVKSNREGVDREFTFGHRCSNRAIDFLAKHGQESFCLVVSYDEPHGPFLCPPEYRAMYEGHEWPKAANHFDTLESKPAHQRAWSGKPFSQADRDAMRIANPDFFGCNSFVDSEIGRVVQAVDQFAPDTLVIYTSDHGDALGAHGLHSKGPAMYDEIARVPFIVRLPDGAHAGETCDHPVSHIDVVPTVLNALGLEKPKLLEGASLLPTLADPATRVNDAVFMEFGRYEIDHDGFGGFQPIRAVCDGRHKLVINLLTSDELYDLAADPQEMVNLIESPAHTAIRDRLHDAMLDWMNRTRDPFRGYYWERRPWRTDARAATWGYTGMTRQREDEYEPRQLDYDTGLEMTEAVRKK